MITRADTRFTDELDRTYREAGYWGQPTLWEFIERNAREVPDQVGFIDAYRRINWRELHDESLAVAAALVEAGFDRGDVLAVQLPNRIEVVTTMAAAAAIGVIFCPFATNLRSRETEFILGFSGAKGVVVPDRFAGFSHTEMVRSLRPALPQLERVVVVGGDGSGGGDPYEQLADRSDAAGAVPNIERHRPASHDVFRLLFTSGSTGDPKGVLHTFDSTIYSNIRQNEYTSVDRDTVFLLFIPAVLNWGMFQLIQTILAQCTLVLHESFDASHVLEAIERHRVTDFGGPPTALIALLRDSSLDARNIASLRLIATSGASCPVELLREAHDRLGCTVMEGYGMTEVGWVCGTSRGDPIEETVGSVGKPFPWMELRVLDLEGNDVTAGETGQVAVSGPCICGGYFRNEERNRESWTSDGWFLTGDLGRIDANDRLRLVGRTKEVIKHGGAQVWPREIEEILFTHPKVRDVAVIGIPDDYFGENTCACVIPVTGESVALAEVVEFLEPRIAKYKLPQHLATFEDFPYTSTGKLQKHVLRDRVLERLERASDLPEVTA